MNWYLGSCRPNKRDLFLKQLEFEIDKNQLGGLFLEPISPRDAMYKDLVLLQISDLPSARIHLKKIEQFHSYRTKGFIRTSSQTIFRQVNLRTGFYMLTQSDLILVAGATGGVGQLVAAKLLEKNLSVRILTRNRSQAEQMFDNQVDPSTSLRVNTERSRGVDIVVGDLRYPDTLTSATKDVTHIICCTGTTAFPSQRWDESQLI